MSNIPGSFNSKLASISQLTGLKSHEMSMIFAGPPTLDGAADFPLQLIGIAAELTVGGGRQVQRGKVISSNTDAVMSVQKGGNNGVIRGLGLLVDIDEESAVSSTTTQHRASLLKLLYKPMWMSEETKGIIKYFYAEDTLGKDLGLTPVAYNDSDDWVNFAKSQLFDIPIGIFKVERSASGNTLAATYYENVMLEGTQRSSLTVTSGTPVFSQLQFSCSDINLRMFSLTTQILILM